MEQMSELQETDDWLSLPPGIHKQYLVVGEGVLHEETRIPLHIIRGESPGPVVFLTAAVHGDEINGVPIVRDVIERLSKGHVYGTVIGIPVVNIAGFRRGERYMPDRRDLNRSFPGEHGASLASRTAAALWEGVLSKCTAGVDLHTAALGRANLCHVRGDGSHEQARAMLRAFGTPIMIDGEGPKGALRRHCTDNGVPTIIFEAGEPNRFQSHVVQIGVAGVMRVLKELGVTKRRCTPKPAYQVLLKKSTWARAEHGGILDMMARPGDLVRKNQGLARILDPFGQEVSVVKAPKTGVVIGLNTYPLVHAGEAVLHIGQIRTTIADAREYVRLGGDLGHIDWDPVANRDANPKMTKQLEEAGQVEIQQDESEP